MIPHFLHWLWTTDAGLLTRIALAAAIFLVLALLDLRRHGPHATRWREYLFLLAIVTASLLYGVLNDLLTSTISWEYFYYGKELAEILGPKTPPDPFALHCQAALIGLKATWTVGLILGVALLLANNPSQRRPQLPYRTLFQTLPIIFFTALACSTAGGLLGYFRCLAKCSPDLAELLQNDLLRPRTFECVYGIHLGAYLGGALGLALALLWIRKKRQNPF